MTFSDRVTTHELMTSSSAAASPLGRVSEAAVSEKVSLSLRNEQSACLRLIETVEQRIKRQQSKLEIVERQIAAFDDLPQRLLQEHGDMVAKRYHHFNVKLIKYQTSVRRNRRRLVTLHKTLLMNQELCQAIDAKSASAKK